MLMSLLNLLLYCAVVIFIAFAVVWAWQTFIGPIDGNVFKWGKIIVALLIIIAIVGWLLGVVQVPMLHLRNY